VIEKVTYPTCQGLVEGDLYRPSTRGPHPGIVICLGVVPFGVEHPQVAVLGNALARSGFAALLYWSPAMRDFRLDPEDIESIAMAYRWLVEQPSVDPARSGLFGTCVGGAFALMASASPLIRDRIGFVGAYAPYSSMWTFAQDIASASRPLEDGREEWQVDPLAWKVFLHSITSSLEPAETDWIRTMFANGKPQLDSPILSEDGQAVYSLLTSLDAGQAETALHSLPQTMQSRLTAMSPMNYLDGIHAPLVVLLHDRGDPVIPVAESRYLYAGLIRLSGLEAGVAGVHYTEMQFLHLDPAKGKLPLFRLVRELGKFFFAMVPIFQRVVVS